MGSDPSASVLCVLRSSGGELEVSEVWELNTREWNLRETPEYGTVLRCDDLGSSEIAFDDDATAVAVWNALNDPDSVRQWVPTKAGVNLEKGMYLATIRCGIGRQWVTVCPVHVISDGSVEDLNGVPLESSEVLALMSIPAPYKEDV